MYSPLPSVIKGKNLFMRTARKLIIQGTSKTMMRRTSLHKVPVTGLILAERLTCLRRKDIDKTACRDNAEDIQQIIPSLLFVKKERHKDIVVQNEQYCYRNKIYPVCEDMVPLIRKGCAVYYISYERRHQKHPPEDEVNQILYRLLANP